MRSLQVLLVCCILVDVRAASIDVDRSESSGSVLDERPANVEDGRNGDAGAVSYRLTFRCAST